MKKVKELIQKLSTGMMLTIPSLVPVDKSPGKDYPQTLVSNLITYVLWFLGALAVIFVIYGGILYITSGGDADKTKKARDTLLYAVIGIVVVVLAIAIVNWAAALGRGDLTP